MGRYFRNTISGFLFLITNERDYSQEIMMHLDLLTKAAQEIDSTRNTEIFIMDAPSEMGEEAIRLYWVSAEQKLYKWYDGIAVDTGQY